MYLAMVMEIDTLGGNRISFAIDHPTWIGWQLSATGAAWWRISIGAFTPTLAANTPGVVEFWRTGTSVRARVNGTIDTDTKTSSENFRTNRGLAISTIGNGSTFPMDGEIMETIFCDGTVAPEQRDACMNYLIAKWGT